MCLEIRSACFAVVYLFVGTMKQTDLPYAHEPIRKLYNSQRSKLNEFHNRMILKYYFITVRLWEKSFASTGIRTHNLPIRGGQEFNIDKTNCSAWSHLATGLLVGCFGVSSI